MHRPLKKTFFERPVLEVAPDLLGKYLVYNNGNTKTALRITEVEAYDGENDAACHAAKGRTKRTEVLFGPAGVWYVYLIYGMYEMLNIVTGPIDFPAAVLIRGVDGYDGPGKLTKALHITREVNATKATPAGGLWIEDRGVVVLSDAIERTARIGVTYAGKDATKPWRFILHDKK